MYLDVGTRTYKLIPQKLLYKVIELKYHTVYVGIDVYNAGIMHQFEKPFQFNVVGLWKICTYITLPLMGFFHWPNCFFLNFT